MSSHLPLPALWHGSDDGGEVPQVGPDTVLVRAQDVLMRLTNEDEIGIEIDGERHLAPRVAIAILDAFSVPRSVKEVLASMPSSGTEHYVELSTCIEDLADRGVLVDPSSRGEQASRGWVRPNVHLSMLDDRARTKGFCDALREAVRPEDVVVDIGTGTGILATCAAKAGARQVYAVESSGIAEVAARMFEANGVAERVMLVRRRSTSATLPELASVLVTETIGNDPLDEQLLEIIADAKHRLLAPGARIIPSAIQIYAVAVDIPRTLLEKHVFTARKLEGYRAVYEMNFEVLEDHRLSSTEPIMVDSRDVVTWPLGPPVLLAEIDFSKDFDTWIATRAQVTVSRDTQYLGILLAFRAKLAEGIVLSTLPDDFDPTSHWAHALFPAFDHPVLAKGDTVDIEYSYDRGTTMVRVFRD
jgi:precorrin-6B methylase 2